MATSKATLREFAALISRAADAGAAAGTAITPTPMHIRGYAPIADGVCGFAWVTVRPGTSSFARFLKREYDFSKAYYGGVEKFISLFGGQSMERKEAYASAYATVLRDAGFDATSGSRMD